MGTTFTALNAEIKSVGGQALIGELSSIDKKVETTAARMKDALARTGNDLQAATRLIMKEADQTTAAVERIGAAASRSFGGTAAAAEGMSVRSARATQGVARGLEMVARTGRLTGRSLDAVLSNISGLALGFGTGGVLVGAIGIATASIIELFMRTRRELEKTQDEFNKRLVEMGNSNSLAGLAGQGGLLAHLQGGDPFAAIAGKRHDETDLQFLRRSQGKIGLEQEAARLQESIAKNPSIYREGSEDADRLREVKKLIVEITSEMERANKVAGILVGKAVDENGNAIATKADKVKPPKFSRGGFSDLPEWMKQIRDNVPLTPTGASERDQLKTQYEAYGIEAQITADVEKRLELRRKMVEVLKQIDDLDENNVKLNPTRPKASKLPVNVDVSDAVQRIKAIAQQAGEVFVSTLGSSLTRGFEAMFSRGGNIGGGFRALTGALLQGLGTMFQEAGEAALVGLGFMQAIKDAILAFAPEVGILAAVGMIALGSALKGAGGAIGSSGPGGGGGYGGGGYSGLTHVSYTSPAAPASMSSGSSVAQRPTVNNTNFIIGPSDPQAQRAWNELQRSSLQRGSIG